jgi:hypothetical protein
MEIFYYQCIYDILQNPETRLGRVSDGNMLKAKIDKLHSVRMEGANFDGNNRETFNEKRASIYHIMKQK